MRELAAKWKRVSTWTRAVLMARWQERQAGGGGRRQGVSERPLPTGQGTSVSCHTAVHWLVTLQGWRNGAEGEAVIGSERKQRKYYSSRNQNNGPASLRCVSPCRQATATSSDEWVKGGGLEKGISVLVHSAWQAGKVSEHCSILLYKQQHWPLHFQAQHADDDTRFSPRLPHCANPHTWPWLLVAISNDRSSKALVNNNGEPGVTLHFEINVDKSISSPLAYALSSHSQQPYSSSSAIFPASSKWSFSLSRCPFPFSSLSPCDTPPLELHCGHTDNSVLSPVTCIAVASLA